MTVMQQFAQNQIDMTDLETLTCKNQSAPDYRKSVDGGLLFVQTLLVAKKQSLYLFMNRHRDF